MKASFTITREFCRKVTLKRLARRWWLPAIGVLLILPSLCNAIRWRNFDGITAIGTVAILVIVYKYLMAWRNANKVTEHFLAKQKGDPIEYEFTEDELKTNTHLGSSSIKWDNFKTLRITPLYTLLELAVNKTALSIPTDQLDSATLDYLKQLSIKHNLEVIERPKKKVSA